MVEILDRHGEVTVRVGEAIRMGGGEVVLTEALRRQLREPLPDPCQGPYWLMGELLVVQTAVEPGRGEGSRPGFRR